MRTFSDGQWSEFWAKVLRGEITQAHFQGLLDNPGVCLPPSPRPTPDTAGLEAFEIEVNFDDLRWRRIDFDGESREQLYTDCYESARTGDFPIAHRGKHMVEYVLFPENYFAHALNLQQVLDEIARRNLDRPDRAITETILDAPPVRNTHTIGGVCGVIQINVAGDTVVGDIWESDDGRLIELSNLKEEWLHSCRVVAVVRIK